MSKDFLECSKILKVMADPKRLRIVSLLSERELCASQLLEFLDITQPTLSHDMHLLENAEVVISRREGKKTFYRLNAERLKHCSQIMREIINKI